MTQDEYEWRMATFSRFIALGPTVWRNWSFVADRIVLSFEVLDERKVVGEKALACVQYQGKSFAKPQAIGRSILRAMPGYALVLSNRLMREYTGVALDKILLHELVHLGYGGHGKDFQHVCKEVGGVIYGAAAVSSKVYAEQKQANGRYKRLHEFESEAALQAWWIDPVNVKARMDEVLAWMRAHPGRSERDAKAALRWRMTAGG